MKTIFWKPDWQWMLVATLLVTVLTIHSQVKAESFTDNLTIQLDIGHTNVKHKWDDTNVEGYPSNAIAIYKPEMVSVGVTAWHKSDFGIRLAHGFMEEEAEQSGGHYKNVSLEFTGITSLELMYRYNILSNTYIFAGIGTYKIPMNHIYYRDGVVIGGRPDADDDEGYFVGINQRLSKHFGLEYRYTRYSEIGNYEYTKGFTINITYKL